MANIIFNKVLFLNCKKTRNHTYTPNNTFLNTKQMLIQ